MANSTGKLITAFLAGAAAGAFLGILLAPDKGENTRKKVKKTFDDLADKAQETFDKYTKPPKTETKERKV